MTPINKRWDAPTMIVSFRVPVNSKISFKTATEAWINGHIAPDGTVNSSKQGEGESITTAQKGAVAAFVDLFKRLAGVGKIPAKELTDDLLDAADILEALAK